MRSPGKRTLRALYWLTQNSLPYSLDQVYNMGLEVRRKLERGKQRAVAFNQNKPCQSQTSTERPASGI